MGKVMGKEILKAALAAWHKGHRVRLQNRNPGFESRPGEKFYVFKNCYAVVKT
jgi:hypothetical protein